MNKCRIYVTSPFLSLVQTSECQGTTSPQHGCKGPRSEPLELLGANRKTQHWRCYFRKSGGENYASPKGTREFWRTAAEVGHRSGKESMQDGSRRCRTVVSQHTPDILPSNIFDPPGCSAESSPMYCIVPHMVNARPPRFSRRESPKSDKRRWPASKETTEGSDFSRTVRLHPCVKFFFCYLDHLRGHFPSKSTKKKWIVIKKYSAAGYLR